MGDKCSLVPGCTHKAPRCRDLLSPDGAGTFNTSSARLKNSDGEQDYAANNLHLSQPGTGRLVALVFEDHHAIIRCMRLHGKLASLVFTLACCSRTPPSAAPPPHGAASSAAPAAVTATGSTAAADARAPVQLSSVPLGLSDANGPAALDFIFFEPGRARVWIPGGSTGNVDVLDGATGALVRIPGFKTEEREAHGKKRVVGPSSGSIGEKFAYIGNRAGRQICAVELATLQRAPCIELPSAPDGVEYVASARELWVTLPKDDTIAILDASSSPELRPKDTIKLDGAPECYALDERHGTFFTNLEDKDRTLVIDVKTRKTVATWAPGCGAEGPRGIAFDVSDEFVIVACTDHVQVLDAAHGGTPLGKFDTGAGLDAIDYVEETHLLYAAAGKAQRLSVVRVSKDGQLTLAAQGSTSEGARNAVADARGNVYVADTQQARLLVFHPGAPNP